MFSSLQDWATWREESESEQQQDNTLRIRKLEFEKRRRKKERQRRRLVTGEGEEVGQPLKQNIQSFFPTFQEFHDPSRHNPGLAREDEDNENGEDREGAHRPPNNRLTNLMSEIFMALPIKHA